MTGRELGGGGKKTHKTKQHTTKGKKKGKDATSISTTYSAGMQSDETALS